MSQGVRWAADTSNQQLDDGWTQSARHRIILNFKAAVRRCITEQEECVFDARARFNAQQRKDKALFLKLQEQREIRHLPRHENTSESAEASEAERFFIEEQQRLKQEHEAELELQYPLAFLTIEVSSRIAIDFDSILRRHLAVASEECTRKRQTVVKTSSKNEVLMSDMSLADAMLATWQSRPMEVASGASESQWTGKVEVACDGHSLPHAGSQMQVPLTPSKLPRAKRGRETSDARATKSWLSELPSIAACEFVERALKQSEAQQASRARVHAELLARSISEIDLRFGPRSEDGGNGPSGIPTVDLAAAALQAVHQMKPSPLWECVKASRERLQASPKEPKETVSQKVINLLRPYVSHQMKVRERMRVSRMSALESGTTFLNDDTMMNSLLSGLVKGSDAYTLVQRTILRILAQEEFTTPAALDSNDNVERPLVVDLSGQTRSASGTSQQTLRADNPLSFFKLAWETIELDGDEKDQEPTECAGEALERLAGRYAWPQDLEDHIVHSIVGTECGDESRSLVYQFASPRRRQRQSRQHTQSQSPVVDKDVPSFDIPDKVSIGSLPRVCDALVLSISGIGEMFCCRSSLKQGVAVVVDVQVPPPVGV